MNDNIIISPALEIVAVASENASEVSQQAEAAEFDETTEDDVPYEPLRFQFGACVKTRVRFHVTETWRNAGFGREERERLYATRQSSLRTATSAWLSSSSSYPTYIMADPKKQEKDYTKEVDELLPEVRSLAQVRRELDCGLRCGTT